MFEIAALDDELAFLLPGQMTVGLGLLVGLEPVHEVLKNFGLPRELIDGGGGVDALVNALEAENVADMDLLGVVGNFLCHVRRDEAHAALAGVNNVAGEAESMEEALFRTMLFDSYGELLTEKQREYFDLHYNEDLSLAEIAQSEGVSRQSVWDIIRRAEETMRRFEEKTGLVARFAAERDILAAAQEKLARLETMTDGAAQSLAREIAAALQELGHGI